MRAILSSALFGLFFVASAAPQAAVSLTGLVVNAQTGSPLSAATVKLRGARQAEMTTEADGQFFFPNLPAGSYRILVERDGFVPTEYGQRWIDGPGVPIQLGAGAGTVSVRVGMVATGTISGRITDVGGQPIANAQVQAMKASYQGQLRILVPVQQARTNAAGEYRLFWLTPGRYYVSMSVPAGWPTAGQLVVRSGARGGPDSTSVTNQPRPVLGQAALSAGAAGPTDGELGPVFFPTTTERTAAAPIDVRPGSDFRGTDMYLPPIRKYQVCGTVAVTGVRPVAPRGNTAPPPNRPDIGGNPATRAPRVEETCGADQSGGLTAFGLDGGSVQLIPLDIEIRSAGNAPGNRYAASVNSATGQFYLKNVLPGTYDLSTFIGGMAAAATVVVQNSDVEHLALTLAPGATLPARIVIDGNGSDAESLRAALPGLTVVIGSDPPSQGTSPNATPSTSGSFNITNVTPRDNRVYVVPLLNSPVTIGTAILTGPLQNAYVKSAKLGDVEVLNTGMRFAGQPDLTLEIVLGLHPGAIVGSVINESQEPGTAVFVTVIPDIATARLFRTDMYKTSSTDATGRFEIRGLPPGDYKAFAWEGYEKDAWLDPDFFKPFEQQGVTIHVDEGKVQSLSSALAPVHAKND